MRNRLMIGLLSCTAVIGLATPAHAQSIGQGGGGDSGSGEASDGGADSGKERPKRGKRGGAGPGRISIDPYIEVAQTLDAQLSPTSETLTYTSIAAGVDASVNGRNNAGSVSLRYERRFGYGRAEDSDTISGVARASVSIVPQTVRFEAGAMAQRTQVQSNGGAVIGGGFGDPGSSSNIYSVYAGPVVSTHAGDVKIDASYRIGYTKVTEPDAFVAAPGGAPVDVFDSSVVHNAEFHAGTRPHEVLPVGLGLGAGYYQEDVSNLDQRVRDLHARADINVPVGQSVALVGGIGYEDVEISSRDAVFVGGVPVVGSDGRLVTDQSAPRQIAYEASGLIWDVGVMWKPSPRTSLEAHVGRRYGSTSYFGTFGWAPSRRQSVNIAVYDNVAGFGGQVNRALANLPTQFQSIRNPLTGDTTGCVASLDSGTCLGGALGSVRSSTFRARGVAATYGLDLGRITTGIGVGYDRRTFFAAPGTILAAANGLVDENYWLAAYLDAQLGQRSNLSTNVYANWFHSGFAGSGDASALGATVAYRRSLTNRLSGTLALGIDGVNREFEDDYWTASALAGVRYSF